MTVEYRCEGCGMPIVNVSVDVVPPHQFCAICQWLDEHERPQRIMEARRRMEPGGWETERERRAELAPVKPRDSQA